MVRPSHADGPLLFPRMQGTNARSPPRKLSEGVILRMCDPALPPSLPWPHTYVRPVTSTTRTRAHSRSLYASLAGEHVLRALSPGTAPLPNISAWEALWA